jgi:hypothetical protein
MTSHSQNDLHKRMIGGGDIKVEVCVHTQQCADGSVRVSQEVPIPVGLRLTNKGDKPLFLTLYQSFRPVLRDVSGNKLELKAMSNRRRPPNETDFVHIHPGRHIDYIQIVRVSYALGQARLFVEDDTGGNMHFLVKVPDQYELSFHYENTSSDAIAYIPYRSVKKGLPD